MNRCEPEILVRLIWTCIITWCTSLQVLKIYYLFLFISRPVFCKIMTLQWALLNHYSWEFDRSLEEKDKRRRLRCGFCKCLYKYQVCLDHHVITKHMVDLKHLSDSERRSLILFMKWPATIERHERLSSMVNEFMNLGVVNQHDMLIEFAMNIGRLMSKTHPKKKK